MDGFLIIQESIGCMGEEGGQLLFQLFLFDQKLRE